jgi:hypothetical protein
METRVVVEDSGVNVCTFHVGWRPEGLDSKLYIQVDRGNTNALQVALVRGQLGRRNVQGRIPSTVNALLVSRGVTGVAVAWAEYGLKLSVFFAADASISTQRILGIIRETLVKCDTVNERRCTRLRQEFFSNPWQWWKGRSLLNWLGQMPHIEFAPSGTALQQRR